MDMKNLTIEELSIISLYRAGTRKETLRNMFRAPVQEMDEDIRPMYLSARKKLNAMSETDFQNLDLRDTLLMDEDEEDAAYG